MSLKKLIGAAALLLVSSSAYSAVLFENAYTDGTTADTSTNWCSSCGSTWRVWDTFTLGADSDISSIDARIYSSIATLPSLSFEIFTADRTTSLYTKVFTESEMSYSHVSGPNYDLTVFFSDLVLDAGSYALSIWDMGNTSSTFAWSQTTALHDGSGYQSYNADGTGTLGGGTGKDMAFRVHGGPATDVPSPAPLLLIGLGLAAVGYTRRKKA